MKVEVQNDVTYHETATILESAEKKPPINHRSVSADYLIHHDEQFARRHAEFLERLTGDHCEVRQYKSSLFKVIRRDVSGKRVLNCSYLTEVSDACPAA